jgi:hypothetical protein
MSESGKPVSPADEFAAALEEHAPRYGLRLGGPIISRLREYYEQVMAWNARLHLVAPCPPAEFATRHVLESLLAAPHVATGAHVADVGSGAGLPVIPCLILRPDRRRAREGHGRRRALREDASTRRRLRHLPRARPLHRVVTGANQMVAAAKHPAPLRRRILARATRQVRPHLSSPTHPRIRPPLPLHNKSKVQSPRSKVKNFFLTLDLGLWTLD